MAKLAFDATGARFYETGVKNCALYVKDATGAYGNAVAWNGITAVTESPSGAEATPLYADDMKYLNLISVEEFGATVEAYMYPEEFAACNGEKELTAGMFIGQQARSQFGLVYKTKVGNDVNNDLGYKLHIVYNCTAAVSEKAYATVNDSPEAITFSWEVSTTAETFTVNGTEYKTSIITIDSTKLSEEEKEHLTALENELYDDTKPLLLPADVYSFMTTGAKAAA